MPTKYNFRRCHALMPSHLDVSPEIEPIITDLINNMIYVEGGTFEMGKAKVPTKVNDYFVGRFTVTLQEYCAVHKYVDEHFFHGLEESRKPFTKDFGDRWNFDIRQFINALNKLTGRKFRLLTEEEWEYAARGGKKSKGYKYAGSDDIDKVAWYWKNAGSDFYEVWDGFNLVDGYEVNAIHEVGRKFRNELWLYDMNGNVWEECGNFINLGLCGDYFKSVLRGGSVETHKEELIYDDSFYWENGGWIPIDVYFDVFTRCENGNHEVADREIGYRLAHDRNF